MSRLLPPIDRKNPVNSRKNIFLQQIQSLNIFIISSQLLFYLCLYTIFTCALDTILLYFYLHTRPNLGNLTEAGGVTLARLRFQLQFKLQNSLKLYGT